MGGKGGVALWAPPQPVAACPLEFDDPDLFEVQVINEEVGPRLVAAIELVSPSNKDRPANRHMFAVKCASYLYSGVSVIIVDVVTQRSGNLHAALLDLLAASMTTPGQNAHDLYASAYRRTRTQHGLELQTWPHVLGIGDSLPTLPLWLDEDVCLPLDLESTYAAACAARRLEP